VWSSSHRLVWNEWPLARDFGRTPAEVAQSSAQVLDAVLSGA
jgi:hypothetical protein